MPSQSKENAAAKTQKQTSKQPAADGTPLSVMRMQTARQFLKEKRSKISDICKDPEISSAEKVAQLGNIPIAVVGVGALFPGSTEPGGYWRDILAGTDMITEVPETHFYIDDFYNSDPFAADSTYCRTGAFLSPVEFDPMEYGIPPNNIPTTDTSQLLALVVAKQVLEDASKGQFKNMDRNRISVILGVAAGMELLGEMASRLNKPIWQKALREEGLPENQVEEICERIRSNYTTWKESTFPGLLGNVVAGRIANHFDLGGTNCTSDAACASSFSALSQAMNELRLGQSDLVITGGVDTNNDCFLFVSFSRTPALSPTHDCRPFSNKADGMVLGEGIGMVALKRLDDAERDGDRIYAVIRGIGSSSDGTGTSIYSPLAKGQARALRRCYRDAGYSPATVELVEAHGTGTKAGDVVEFEGLSTVFGEVGRKDHQWCALGSVKSQIGHTKSTAAAAGLIKAVMALHHKILPPTIKVEQPDPKLNIEESPFYLNTEARPWVRSTAYPRRASVSSFGFGGTNWHVSVEEYLGDVKNANRLRTTATELLLMSAESQAALIGACRDMLPDVNQSGMLPFLAYTSQNAFNAEHSCRLGIVAANEADLESKLKQAVDLIEQKKSGTFFMPNGIYFSAEAFKGDDIAFLYPGQGSQYVGMGADLAMSFDEVIELWDLVTSIPRDENELEDFFGVNQDEESSNTDVSCAFPEKRQTVADVVFPVPVFTDDDRKEQSLKLMATKWSQPAILTTSLTMTDIMTKMGVEPKYVGGHSLGEITALFIAGVLDLFNLVQVCNMRSRLMAKAAENPGSMTAVIGASDKIQSLLDKWNSDIIIANHNSPNQIVLSGPTPGIEAVEEKLTQEKIKFKRLPVPAAFHSSLMHESCEPFLKYMKNTSFNKPALPVYSCVTAKPHSDDVDEIRNLLAQQLDHPVRFVEQIEDMYTSGVRTFIEVGPGSVLTNLVAQILGDRPHTAINLDHKNDNGVTALWKGLGRLAVSGTKLDFSCLWQSFATPADPRKKKKPRMSVSLLGCNYGRPFPPPEGKSALPKPNPAKPKAEETMQPAQESKNTNKKDRTMQTIKEKRQAQPTVSSPMSSSASPSPSTPLKPSAAPQGPAASRAPQPERPAHPSVPPAGPHHNAQQQQAVAPAQHRQMAAASNAAPVKRSYPPLINGNDYQNWLGAYQELQRQTTEVHSSYQRMMAESHIAFLNTAETSTLALSSMLNGRPVGINKGAGQPQLSAPVSSAPSQMTSPPPVQYQDPAQYSAPQPVPAPAMPSQPAAQEVKPAAPPPQTPAAMTSQPPVAPQSSPPVQPAKPAPQPAPASVAAVAIDYKEMLLEVVADKTGYPREILSEEMSLESDLGIDSIKRVEIFSAVKDQQPDIPEVDASEMSNIETLGDVIAYIERVAPSAGAPSQAAPTSTDQAAAAPGPAPMEQRIPDDVDLTEMLLTVVADKTGYPKEILSEDMSLESDLGIDSIKRVEILSAVKDQSPWLPEVDASEMASIETLGDVIKYIEDVAPAMEGAAAPAAGGTAQVAQPVAQVETVAVGAETVSIPEGVDLTEMLMEVVADKTGYPKDILTPDMDLESDLGIDSIKRVEILSAVKDQSPWLPEVDAGEMASIQTLSDVIDYIERVVSDINGAPAADTDTHAPAIVESAAASQPAAQGPSLGRYGVRCVAAPNSGFALNGLDRAQNTVITDDGAGIAQELQQLFAARGLTAHVADPDSNTDAVIFLGGLKRISKIEDAITVNREAFQAAHSVAERFTEQGGVFVTVQNTGGDFGLSDNNGHRVWLGGLPGLVKTAGIEWQKAAVKAIDINKGRTSAKKVAELIFRELFSGGPEIEVGLASNGTRYRIESYPLACNASNASLGENDVVVTSGGARGVTARTLIELAKHTQCKMVLLGRTVLTDEPSYCQAAETDGDLKRVLLEEAKANGQKITPAELGAKASKILANREIKATLAAIEAAGSLVKYVVCDVLDASQLAAQLKEIRGEWGPITGVIHGAGLLKDKLIAEKTMDQFDKVFNTKVVGLQSMLAATSKDPLKVICVFSSVAARFGNMGQCDYAMGNEILNKIANAEAVKRGDKCIVKSINWGPWDGGMVSPLLKAHFQEMGVPLIPLDTGAKNLVEEVFETGSDSIEIVIGPEPPRGGLSLTDAAKDMTLRVGMNDVDFPFIHSHEIQGRPVIPVALVLEWFSRAARLYEPGKHIAVCKDLRVLKGIQVDNVALPGTYYTLNCQKVSDTPQTVLSFSIPSESGALHYSATIEMSPDRSDGQLKNSALAALDTWPIDLSQVYSTQLFHGPDFQVIRSLEGISDQGACVMLSGVSDMGWKGDTWKTDVAAIDGGLQLAILWGNHMLGKQSLPTKIGEYQSVSDGLISGPIRCELSGRVVGNDRTVSTISFFDNDGKLAAQMRDVELHMLPNTGSH